MAGYVLHLSTEENITLSSATVKRLIAGGSGDAALLYLAILHARGAADSGKLARELKWDETRLRAAEQALYEMKLVGAPEKKEEAPLPPPQQLSEPPEYTREDIARKLEGDGRFACLLREVEHKLGPLSTPSVIICSYRSSQILAPTSSAGIDPFFSSSCTRVTITSSYCDRLNTQISPRAGSSRLIRQR